MLEKELEGTGRSVGSLMNPPVTITCSFDGIIRSVTIDRSRLDKLTGHGIANAIQAAVSRIKFCEPPPAVDATEVPSATANAEFLAHYSQWKSDLLSKAALPEITGVNETRTVIVVYSGRVLRQVRVKASWVSISTNEEIERSIVEASNRAMTASKHD
jgi:DNA-binding protein YbaB